MTDRRGLYLQNYERSHGHTRPGCACRTFSRAEDWFEWALLSKLQIPAPQWAHRGFTTYCFFAVKNVMFLT